MRLLNYFFECIQEIHSTKNEKINPDEVIKKFTRIFKKVSEKNVLYSEDRLKSAYFPLCICIDELLSMNSGKLRLYLILNQYNKLCEGKSSIQDFNSFKSDMPFSEFLSHFYKSIINFFNRYQQNLETNAAIEFHNELSSLNEKLNNNPPRPEFIFLLELLEIYYYCFILGYKGSYEGEEINMVVNDLKNTLIKNRDYIVIDQNLNEQNNIKLFQDGYPINYKVTSLTQEIIFAHGVKNINNFQKLFNYQFYYKKDIIDKINEFFDSISIITRYKIIKYSSYPLILTITKGTIKKLANKYKYKLLNFHYYNKRNLEDKLIEVMSESNCKLENFEDIEKNIIKNSKYQKSKIWQKTHKFYWWLFISPIVFYLIYVYIVFLDIT